jgi:hypothetical protein
MSRAKKWTLDMIIKSQSIGYMLQETRTVMQGIIALSYLTISIRLFFLAAKEFACKCVKLFLNIVKYLIQNSEIIKAVFIGTLLQHYTLDSMIPLDLGK